MKKLLFSVAVGLAVVSAGADTAYPIAAETAAANRAAVEKFADAAYWKGWPLAVEVVDPMSGWRFLPDRLPRGGSFTNGVFVILAKDEYENGSVCLFGFDDLAAVELVPKNLPADTDVKVVKTWYQQGSAWYGGFQSDVTRRVLTPELMLHDETLVSVDYGTKDNFVRCDYGRETKYRWISTTGPDVDHTRLAEPDRRWIRDAATPKPFSLQKNCFKQVMFTFHAPADARPGLVRGAFEVRVAGKRVGEIPVALKVLPFTLPKPMTFRDPTRRFLPSGYCRTDVLEMPRFAANLAAHGVDTAYVLGKDTSASLERTKELKEILEKNGLNRDVLMCALPGCGAATSYPAEETDKSYRKHLEIREKVAKAMANLKEVFGREVKAYSYGWDEAPPSVVRAERATWKEVQRVGGRTVVSTGFHPYLLFNLDAANIPRQPRLRSRIDAEKLHAANPDFIASWYGDPHSGPENPDYNRRLYGWLTWRNNYDSFSQFIIFRDDWSEFYVWKESFLRGLMIVYPAADDVLGTLAWEATREAVDDIRYGTLLKTLAEEARTSSDVERQYLGRAALSWIAQVDFERSSLDSLRLETINWILKLRKED